VISTTATQDETSTVYQHSADRFVQLPQQTPDAVRLIRSLGLDVLLFTDLGMSVVTLALAHVKLAPRQAVLWGHPVTTGIRTMDDFLSGELYEGPDGDDHYTERLVRLPGLQTCYPKPKLDRVYNRAEFGLPDNGTLYGCPQTLFKFHPEFDPLLQTIMDADSDGWLVLVKGRNRHWADRLMARWRRTAPRVAERALWVPPIPRLSFIGLGGLFDVALDTPHFGGGNTTLELLAVGTPVVTLPSPFLRSRLAAGMYQHIGLPDLVSQTADAYMKDAIRLGTDREWNRHVRSRIATSADKLFDQVDSVHAFEAYLTLYL